MMQWFIKPLGSYIPSNEAIANELSRVGLTHESVAYDLVDEKGEKHHGMWRVEHRFIEMLKYYKSAFQFRFRIFHREGERGILREWKFPIRKKSKKAKQAPKRLKEIQERRKAIG